jgi:2-hydroxy-3-keto-5-methylthiopentenyl-1-phosphate phosphatase
MHFLCSALHAWYFICYDSGTCQLSDVSMECVVMTDFDGTMITIDTAVFLLDKFAPKNWRIIEEQFERGEITFEESLAREFAMLKVSEQEMLKALEPAAHFRPNFHKMVEYCTRHEFQLVVVSGGLDFCIRHFLALKGWSNLETYTPKARHTVNGIELSFPNRLEKMSTNIKDDFVVYQMKRGKKVVYIGNGVSDYPAARIADLAFAIKGSKLAQLCRNGGVACKEITDFQQAVDSIEDWLSR